MILGAVHCYCPLQVFGCIAGARRSVTLRVLLDPLAGNGAVALGGGGFDRGGGRYRGGGNQDGRGFGGRQKDGGDSDSRASDRPEGFPVSRRGTRKRKGATTPTREKALAEVGPLEEGDIDAAVGEDSATGRKAAKEAFGRRSKEGSRSWGGRRQTDNNQEGGFPASAGSVAGADEGLEGGAGVSMGAVATTRQDPAVENSGVGLEPHAGRAPGISQKGGTEVSEGGGNRGRLQTTALPGPGRKEQRREGWVWREAEKGLRRTAGPRRREGTGPRWIQAGPRGERAALPSGPRWV